MGEMFDVLCLFHNWWKWNAAPRHGANRDLLSPWCWQKHMCVDADFCASCISSSEGSKFNWLSICTKIFVASIWVLLLGYRWQWIQLSPVSVPVLVKIPELPSAEAVINQGYFMSNVDICGYVWLLSFKVCLKSLLFFIVIFFSGGGFRLYWVCMGRFW